MFKLPNDTQRLTIVGRTGSGKTVAGIWQLANRKLAGGRWIIFDFKRDRLIQKIEHAREIPVEGGVPSRSGLYVVRPGMDQAEEVNQFLWKIWGEENTGVFLDEGYMIPDKSAFRALLTQGRSKNIPMIILAQRPAWISKFIFSEADFFQVFALTDKYDKIRIREFTGHNLAERRIPRYHSIYHDVAEDNTILLGPAPLEDRILSRFSAQLARPSRFI